MMARKHPSGAMVIKMITQEPKTVSEDDVEVERAAADYDAVIYQAWLDLNAKPIRFHTLPDDSRTLEDPTERLLRLGREAIESRMASELFSFLMSETRNGAALPRATNRATITAQRRLDIANAFKDFLRRSPPQSNFKQAKSNFRIDVELEGINGLRPSQAAVDDALAAHDIAWEAYCIDAARKGKRGSAK